MDLPTRRRSANRSKSIKPLFPGCSGLPTYDRSPQSAIRASFRARTGPISVGCDRYTANRTARGTGSARVRETLKMISQAREGPSVPSAYVPSAQFVVCSSAEKTGSEADDYLFESPSAPAQPAWRDLGIPESANFRDGGRESRLAAALDQVLAGLPSVAQRLVAQRPDDPQNDRPRQPIDQASISSLLPRSPKASPAGRIAPAADFDAPSAAWDD